MVRNVFWAFVSAEATHVQQYQMAVTFCQIVAFQITVKDV